MAVKEILLLGNPKLYDISQSVLPEELEKVRATIPDLHDTLMNFRKMYNCGRAIAAPQIGIFKRIIYMFIEKPTVFINPYLSMKSKEMFEIWDDCMSFPDLLVKVLRHEKISITYRDQNWQEQKMDLKGDLSELLQHEYDHLDGILAVSRAIDSRSFALRSQKMHI